MFPRVSAAINEACALEAVDPMPETVLAQVVDLVCESYGHLRLAEISHALKMSLVGSLEGAPEAYGKIGLQWIGRTLKAYDEYRAAAMLRVREQLPALPAHEGPDRETVENEFGEFARRAYRDAVEGKELDEITLPEVYKFLQSLGHDIDNGRKRDLMKLATKVIETADAAQEISIDEYFARALAKSQNRDTKATRIRRKAMAIACRELIWEMKKKGVEL